VNRAVVALDVAVLIWLGLALVGPLFGIPSPFTALQGSVLVTLQAIGFYAVVQKVGGYRMERYTRAWHAIPDVIAGFGAAVVITAIILSAFQPEVLRRANWLYCWEACLFLLLLVDRQIARLMVYVVRRRHLLRRNVVIVGNGPTCDQIISRLSDPALHGDFEIVGIVGIADGQNDEAGPAAADGIEALHTFALENPIDLVIVALPWSRSPKVFEVLERLQWLSADVVVPFDSHGFQPRFAKVIDVAGVNTLQLMYKPLKGSLGLLKLAEDYAIAVTAFLVIWPFLLGAAVLIRLDSKGPILFRQKRTGFNDKTFSIYKFRTMSVDTSDDGSVGARGLDDPRITRVGRVLRRFSIDEFPQILNVLRGEMSIVGPRPYVPNMLVGEERFAAAARDFAARHRIKPGITGYAQVHGLHGTALQSVAEAQRSIRMDVHYILNWSFWFDVRILLRTVVIAITGQRG
jgi:putative colanic acid biosynthesis UDP-glucose lipid carrier transferase